MAIDLDTPRAEPQRVAPTPIVITRDYSTPDRIFRRGVQLSKPGGGGP